MTKKYKNYKSNHHQYSKIKSSQKYFYKKDLIEQIKNKNVLEIGFGSGEFIKICLNNEVKKIIGIEACDEFYYEVKKKFPKVEIILGDALKELPKIQKKFDVVYLDNILEHFTKKEGLQFLKKIKKVLHPKGIIINRMPNASAIFQTGYLRYIDITHEILYNENSIAQLGHLVGFKNITSFNQGMETGIIHKIIHKIFLKITTAYFMILGFSIPKIYTKQFITILSKK